VPVAVSQSIGTKALDGGPVLDTALAESDPVARPYAEVGMTGVGAVIHRHLLDKGRADALDGDEDLAVERRQSLVR
jgi:hypothetical protein